MKSLVSKLGLGHRRKASGDSSAKSTSSSSKEQQPPQQPPQLQPPPPLPPQQQQKTPSSSSRRGNKHSSSQSSSSVSSSSSSSGNKSRKNITNTSDANVPLLSKSLSSSPSSRSSSGAGNNNRANQQHHGILHKSHRPPHPHNNHMDNDPPHPSRVRFAPQQNSSPHSHNSGYLSSLSSTTSSPSQVHLMACGASVASASVVSKDSIFDRVLREENERLNAMGMGSRDPYDGEEEGSNEGKKKKDPMRGGRRVEI